jgi:tetratricopeptide (TPR) repeat protein
VSKALPHNRLVTQAAKEVLAPLGLTQKGRSRVWLDDHAWWLGVVEFQPSSWSRGTYLNVGAMWLWRRDDDYVYFTLGDRVDEPFREYEDEEQFLEAAREVARRAASEVERLRGRIRDYGDVAKAFEKEARKHGSWAAWDAAVALTLAGKPDKASELFGRAARSDPDVDWWQPVRRDAARFADLVLRDPGAVRAEVYEWIGRYREALKLPPL